MKEKSMLGLMLFILTICTISLVFNTQTVFAEEAIHIRSDGSVSPLTAPITRAGNTYTFTANISDPIVIEKDDIVIDGNGYTLLGSGENYGLSLGYRSNVTIRKTRITGYHYGVLMNLSTSNTVTENFIENNALSAIWLESSTTTSITNNTLTNNYCGILLTQSANNNITSEYAKNDTIGIWIMGSTGNTVRNCTFADSEVCGIWLDQSSATIYSNNFINNTRQAVTTNSTNTWDNGYPTGGNYWSNYTGVDVKSGPNQDQPGSDGIIDAPYKVDANNTDRYPLKNPQNYGLETVLPGDINRDSQVSLADLVLLARAYGARSTDSNWNLNADLDNDGKIGLTDLVVLAQHYGQHSP
jgi:parallel beta-helix repeat protein